ncbi:MAG: CTP synthetase, partial [Deltaproteobacteria bacterium]
IPHITEEIKSCINKLREDGADLAIIEIGGTVGDIESLPFLEAIRQFRVDVGKENVVYIHLTLVPYIKVAGELKTKPTQHSVKELRSIGIQPDILLCRTERYLTPEVKAKIAHFCDVEQDAVITAKDVETIYEVPLVFHKEGLDEKIVKLLNIWTRRPHLRAWEMLVDRIKNPSKEVTIAVVGKYVNLRESYKSLNEALVHGGCANDARVLIRYIESEEVEKEGGEELVKDVDGVLVPGGFGSRGIEGKIKAIKNARENKIPFFGICLGMQLAVVEFSRNVAKLEGAHSEEFNPHTPYPVIYLMREWFDYQSQKIVYRDEKCDYGGTMRLGAYPCILENDSLAYSAYRTKEIFERHRHRYEFNKEYFETLGEAGLQFTGLSPDKSLVEIVELKDHPWYLGCQFHPEFKSRPMAPHPLFASFIKAALDYRERNKA